LGGGSGDRCRARSGETSPRAGAPKKKKEELGEGCARVRAQGALPNPKAKRKGAPGGG